MEYISSRVFRECSLNEEGSSLGIVFREVVEFLLWFYFFFFG